MRNSLWLVFGGVLWAQGVKLPAELQAWQKVAVTARVTGVVERVLVDRGSVVKEGDLLVELSAPEMKAQLAEVEVRALAVEAQKGEAEARRAAAESLASRLKTASATAGAVSANELIQAEKQVASLTALLAGLEKNAAAVRAQADVVREMMGYLRITAPFAGVITERMVSPGALAGPAAGALVELQQVSRLRLVVALPESEWKGLVIGARLSFTVPAWPGRTFAGVVARRARVLDAKTRTMPVELDVANGDGALGPGMYAEVMLPAKGK
ncbi:MAG: efflux RND transporter periplasmic adaptor subunit [Bryobacterales bacterium]|nr:efflux RND transporter periplasmic adaptor subunit [Bryobacterales bacterium]